MDRELFVIQTRYQPSGIRHLQECHAALRPLQTAREAAAGQVRIVSVFVGFCPNRRGLYRRAGVRRRPAAAARSRFLFHDVMSAFIPV